MCTKLLCEIDELLAASRFDDARDRCRDLAEHPTGSVSTLVEARTMAGFGRSDQALSLLSGLRDDSFIQGDPVLNFYLMLTEAVALKSDDASRALRAARASADAARRIMSAEERALCLFRSSDLLLGMNQAVDALHEADAALAAAVESGTHSLVAEAHGRRALALSAQLQWDGALAAAKAMRCSAHKEGDKSAEADALNLVASCLEQVRRYRESLDAALLGVRLAREAGDPKMQALCLQTQSDALRSLQRFDEAVEPSEAAVRVLDEADDTRALARALMQYGVALSDAGRQDERENVLARLEQLPEKLSEKLWCHPLVAHLEAYPVRPGWSTRVAGMLRRKSEREQALRDLLRTLPSEPVLPDGMLGEIHLLRRWASYTTVDLMRSDKGEVGSGSAAGGGYFLRCGDWGLAIDPGLGFGGAFRDAGLCPLDIDAVVATHHHIDHTGDMLSLITCLFEMSEEGLAPNAGFYLGPGAFGAFAATLAHAPGVSALHLMRAGESREHQTETGLHVRITATPAMHPDLSGRPDASIGVVVELGAAGGWLCRIGVTGDTRYFAGLGEHFSDLDAVVVHIGSVYPQDIGEVVENPPWHLGIGGTIRLLREATRTSRTGWEPLVILSEWGEELRAERGEMCRVIAQETGLQRIWPAERGGRCGLGPGEAAFLCHEHPDRRAVRWAEDDRGNITYCCEDHADA